MTVLSDVSLKALLPWSEPGPCSIDLHLGDTLLWWPPGQTRDPRTDQAWLWLPAELRSEGTWRLYPHVRYLIATRERITLPADCAGQIAGRSSWGRDGLAVICGPAGFLDCGYDGFPTLELSVLGSDLVIWPGAAVAQLIVHQLDAPSAHPYAGKYQGDREAVPSRFHLEASR